MISYFGIIFKGFGEENMPSLNAVIFYHVVTVPGAACPLVVMAMTCINLP
jgi:hypothetical protein